MTDPTIDKHIPVPAKGRNRKYASKYVSMVPRMEPGDSLLVPTHKDVVALLSAIRRLLGRKPVQRKQEDGSFRVWVTDEPYP